MHGRRRRGVAPLLKFGVPRFTNTPDSPDGLVRGVGLWGATASNMIAMIGVGPFITIPILLAKMNGPQAILGWVVGAVVALCDGMVWAELGAAMPGTGGPVRFLSEAYGPRTLGRLMNFLFIWQTVFLAPLNLASGAIGFAQYTKFLVGDLPWWEEKALGVAICALTTWMLYRDIRTISKLSVAMWVMVLATVGWITGAGLLHFNAHNVLDFPPGAFVPNKAFFYGLGGATLIAMYDYNGYNNVCSFAGEVHDPPRVIPRSILWSVVVVAILYMTMNIGIISVVPWRDAIRSSAIASDFVQRLYGVRTAQVVTVLVLWTTVASLFAGMLACSRIPYAAAVEGRFFHVFAKLHPTRRFPSFSVLFMGAASALLSLLSLDTVVNALIVIQILIQSMAQVLAVTMIRRNRPDIHRPYKMPLYPLTSIIAFSGWFFILVASGLEYILAGLGLLVFGIATYLRRAPAAGERPFLPDPA